MAGCGRKITLFVLLISTFSWIRSDNSPTAESPYPRIDTLFTTDPMYRQLIGEVESYYKAEAKGDSLPGLLVFSYTPSPRDTLYTIAARVNLPYDTIASLNGISSPSAPDTDRPLLIPNMPGIFAPVEPRTDIERLVAVRFHDPESEEFDVEIPVTIIFPEGRRSMTFHPGAHYHPMSRAFFLGILFRLPVEGGRLSSPYGTRSSPFTGEQTFHHGIDIAAEMGTPVIAARSGRVKAAGTDPIFGTFVILAHENGYETVYAHLLYATVVLNQRLESGMILGAIGVSGVSTGPHLHFEIRQQGESKNPSLLLPGEPE